MNDILIGDDSTKNEIPPKIPKTRCQVCKVKIPLALRTRLCKCGGLYCGLHIMDHSCTYDYKKDKVQLTKVVASKVIKV